MWYIHVSIGSCEGELIHLDPELLVIVRCWEWVLESKLRSSARAVSDLIAKQDIFAAGTRNFNA